MEYGTNLPKLNVVPPNPKEIKELANFKVSD